MFSDEPGEGFSISASDHFWVAHDGGQGEARKLSALLEQAFGDFRAGFQQAGFDLNEPDHKLGWISFSDSEHFTRYVLRTEGMDLSRLSGFYSSKTNRVVMVKSNSPEDFGYRSPEHIDGRISAITGDADPNQLVKIAHELAHQLAFNTGLQKRGVMYPLWVSEGLATQYETALLSGGITNAARNDRLVQMRVDGRIIELKEFVCLTRLPADNGRCEDIYAQGWGFFKFLLKHHPDRLREYLKTLYCKKNGYRSIETLHQEFSDHFGTIDSLNKEWCEFIRTR